MQDKIVRFSATIIYIKIQLEVKSCQFVPGVMHVPKHVQEGVVESRRKA